MNPREEIKDIAPKLSQMENEKRRPIPNDYFSELQNNVMNRLEESKKLEIYFEELPDKVLNTVRKEETKVFNIQPFLKYGVAAILLLCIGTLFWNNNELEGDATYALYEEENEDLDFIIEELSMEEILDSDFIDEEALEEILVSYDNEDSSERWVEEIFYDADDDLLEDFL